MEFLSCRCKFNKSFKIALKCFPVNSFCPKVYQLAFIVSSKIECPRTNELMKDFRWYIAITKRQTGYFKWERDLFILKFS